MRVCVCCWLPSAVHRIRAAAQNLTQHASLFFSFALPFAPPFRSLPPEISSYAPHMCFRGRTQIGSFFPCPCPRPCLVCSYTGCMCFVINTNLNWKFIFHWITLCENVGPLQALFRCAVCVCARVSSFYSRSLFFVWFIFVWQFPSLVILSLAFLLLLLLLCFRLCGPAYRSMNSSHCSGFCHTFRLILIGLLVFATA